MIKLNTLDVVRLTLNGAELTLRQREILKGVMLMLVNSAWYDISKLIK